MRRGCIVEFGWTRKPKRVGKFQKMKFYYLRHGFVDKKTPTFFAHLSTIILCALFPDPTPEKLKPSRILQKYQAKPNSQIQLSLHAPQCVEEL